MTCSFRARCCLVALALVGAPAFGQSPAPAAVAEVAKPACQKPDEHPGRLATDIRRKAWAKDVETYGDCLKKYIEDQKLLANAHVKAANSAIELFNAHMGEFQEQAKRASGG